jgi:hypothetical protein
MNMKPKEKKKKKVLPQDISKFFIYFLFGRFLGMDPILSLLISVLLDLFSSTFFIG